MTNDEINQLADKLKAKFENTREFINDLRRDVEKALAALPAEVTKNAPGVRYGAFLGNNKPSAAKVYAAIYVAQGLESFRKLEEEFSVSSDGAAGKIMQAIGALSLEVAEEIAAAEEVRNA